MTYSDITLTKLRGIKYVLIKALWRKRYSLKLCAVSFNLYIHISVYS